MQSPQSFLGLLSVCGQSWKKAWSTCDLNLCLVLNLWLDLYLEVTITAAYSFEILGSVTIFKIRILIPIW